MAPIPWQNVERTRAETGQRENDEIDAWSARKTSPSVDHYAKNAEEND
jgi:hypothetical protein